jgi:hypothetical protein
VVAKKGPLDDGNRDEIFSYITENEQVSTRITNEEEDVHS